MGRPISRIPTTQHRPQARFCRSRAPGLRPCGRKAGRAMPFASRPDLRAAAFSYLVGFLGAQGVAVREEWARDKAAKWASWWARKHRDRRRPRPHTRYSKRQAKRGRVVSRFRRGARADVDGLLVQLAAGRGSTVRRQLAAPDRANCAAYCGA